MRVLIGSESTADDRKTLAAVRSLGRRGVHVTVASDWLLAEPFWSRYCRARVRTPSPSEDPDGYVDFLLHHVGEVRYDAFLPLSDYVTIPLSMHRRAFADRVPVAVPEWDVLKLVGDKLTTLQVAMDVGIKGPATCAPRTLAELEEVAATVRYPCVFKLRGGAGGVGLRFIRTPDELVEAYLALQSDEDLLFDYRPLVQEFIPGPVVDVSVLFNRGEPRAAVVERRIRMLRPEGGAGIHKETIQDTGIRDAAVTLLRKLRWHGPASVEFKVDDRDATPRLMEVNGRFSGALGIAIAAGVDLPYLTAKLARDGEVEPVFDYRVGLRYRWPMPRGLLHATAARGKLRALWDFFGPDRAAHSDLWLTDPLASLAAAIRPFAGTWKDLWWNERGKAANAVRPV